jgi:CRP-like cAMP-binding protein
VGTKITGGTSTAGEGAAATEVPVSEGDTLIVVKTASGVEPPKDYLAVTRQGLAILVPISSVVLLTPPDPGERPREGGEKVGADELQEAGLAPVPLLVKSFDAETRQWIVLQSSSAAQVSDSDREPTSPSDTFEAVLLRLGKSTRFHAVYVSGAKAFAPLFHRISEYPCLTDGSNCTVKVFDFASYMAPASRRIDEVFLDRSKPARPAPRLGSLIRQKAVRRLSGAPPLLAGPSLGRANAVQSGLVARAFSSDRASASAASSLSTRPSRSASLARHAFRIEIEQTVPVGSANGKCFTAYVVAYTALDGRRLTVLKRYSQFHQLHRELQATLTAVSLPQLTSKKILGSRDIATVAKRQRKLARYLNDLTKLPGVVACPVFERFLDADTAMGEIAAVRSDPDTDIVDRSSTTGLADELDGGALGLSSLTAGDVDTLFGSTPLMTVDDGSILLLEGEANDHLWLVEAGLAQVLRSSLPMAYLGIGSVFGEATAILGVAKTSSATVVAQRGLRVRALPRRRLLAIVRADPELGSRLLAHLLRFWCARLASLPFYSSLASELRSMESEEPDRARVSRRLRFCFGLRPTESAIGWFTASWSGHSGTLVVSQRCVTFDGGSSRSRFRLVYQNVARLWADVMGRTVHLSVKDDVKYSLAFGSPDEASSAEFLISHAMRSSDERETAALSSPTPSASNPFDFERAYRDLLQSASKTRTFKAGTVIMRTDGAAPTHLLHIRGGRVRLEGETGPVPVLESYSSDNVSSHGSGTVLGYAGPDDLLGEIGTVGVQGRLPVGASHRLPVETTLASLAASAQYIRAIAAGGEGAEVEVAQLDLTKLRQLVGAKASVQLSFLGSTVSQLARRVLEQEALASGDVQLEKMVPRHYRVSMSCGGPASVYIFRMLPEYTLGNFQKFLAARLDRSAMTSDAAGAAALAGSAVAGLGAPYTYETIKFSTDNRAPADAPGSSVLLVQIQPVKPVPGEPLLFSSVASTPGTSDSDPVDQQSTVETRYTVGLTQPTLSMFAPVVATTVVPRSALHSSLDMMRGRVALLREQVVLCPPRLNSLQQAIQGSVVPMVNAGPVAVARAFLSGERADDDPALVEELRVVMSDFIEVAGEAIQLNSFYMTEKFVKFHDMVVKSYHQLVKDLLGHNVGLRSRSNTGTD